jgi:nucleoside-diphosphate-sugar epimerase
METVLLTGATGFTGKHLRDFLLKKGLKVIASQFDLTDINSISQFLEANPVDYVIHLAAISFVGHENPEEFYQVNTLGTDNLLQALKGSQQPIKKIVIASSANVYGMPENKDKISEESCPQPVNHYACSKLAMEHMVRTHFSDLPIMITRPFNYTGVGQDTRFVLPKIVDAYRKGAKGLELGNIDVYRDFSSIEDIVASYWRLLLAQEDSIIVNLCSGHATSLREVLSIMAEIAGYEIDVSINPAFVRANEIKSQCGDRQKLESLTGLKPQTSLKQTLEQMYHAP